MLSKEMLRLYNEWKLWSKCYGKMIFINGVSSSGKTTICKRLIKIGFNYISGDDMLKNIILSAIDKIPQLSIFKGILTLDDIYSSIYCTSRINKSYSEMQLEAIKTIKTIKHVVESIVTEKESNIILILYKLIYQNALKHILIGQNVVVDGIILTQSELEMTKSFFDFPNRILLLYNSLEDTLKNCFDRNIISLMEGGDNFRSPYYILRQFMQIYRFDPNGNKGIKINNKKICFTILESYKNIEKTLLPPRENDEIVRKEKEAIDTAYKAFKIHDTIYINSELSHDLVIQLDKHNSHSNFLSFFILSDTVNLSDESDNILDFIGSKVSLEDGNNKLLFENTDYEPIVMGQYIDYI